MSTHWRAHSRLKKKEKKSSAKFWENTTSIRGIVYGGVYVPCIYSHARWELLKWLRSLLLCLHEVFWVPILVINSIVCWFSIMSMFVQDLKPVCILQTHRREVLCLQGAVSTPLRWIFKNALWKAIHSCRITCERSESAQEQRIALYKSNQQQQ